MAKTTLIEFNDEFYAKQIRLLFAGTPEARDELKRIHELTLKQYELNGWIDEETLKKLHAPLPSKEKKKKDKESLPVAPKNSPRPEHSSASRQSSIASDVASPSGSPAHSTEDRRSKDTVEKETKTVTKPPKIKVEPAEAPESKKGKAKVFRDDPSIFGPLDAGIKRKAPSEGVPVAKKVKKKQKIIEQRLKVERVASDSEVGSGEKKKSCSSASASPAAKRDSLLADDLGSELGLTCTVCGYTFHTFSQIAIGLENAMIECHECHQLYHMKCHNPPIAGTDVHDPRVVWYCSSCDSKLKKTTSLKSLKMEQMSSSDESNSSKPSDKVAPQKPVTGIASLAADFVAKHKSRVGTKPVSTSSLPPSTLALPPTRAVGIGKLASPSSLSSPKTPKAKGINSLSAERLQELANERLASGPIRKPSATSGLNASNKDRMKMADKRLQMMKKKAEKKMFR